MSGVLIAAPLRVEQLLIRSAARGARVVRTGMGPRKSQAAAGELSREEGDALLVLGFCGGLDAESAPGDVVVADDVLVAPDEQHVAERLSCDRPEGLARALERTGLRVRTGAVVCVSRIAVGERRAELRASGAIAVDMESAWLARGARGRPFDVVRVVLDSPSHELLRPGAAVGAARAARALRRVARELSDFGTEG
ncbi:MAG: 1-hydroxy-2-methyl-2-butenyl 4-diphosphate reductase [Actinobacteria bacterium]|nr:MAG: 1-hydroxy-2-methyl-2-butenyl 4-diphosphate reductase [Actinomycetota bacterium]